MPAREMWWRGRYEGLGDGRYRCLACGEEGDARGGWCGRHLWGKHGVKQSGAEGSTEPPSAGAPPRASDVPDPAALTRDANLAALLRDATDQSAPLHARVMARKTIMEALGQLDDPPEEDVAERRRKWMAMHEEGLRSIEDARRVVREEMSDPVKRGEMKQILAEVEG